MFDKEYAELKAKMQATVRRVTQTIHANKEKTRSLLEETEAENEDPEEGKE